MRPWSAALVLAAAAAACAARTPAPPPPPPATAEYTPPPAWHALAPVPAAPTRASLADWAWACAAEVSTMRAWLTSQIVVDRQRKDIILLACHNDKLVAVRAAENTLADHLADLPDTERELALTARVFAAACDRVRGVAEEAESCGTEVIVEAPPIEVEAAEW
jgi:hypothetical protein